MHISLSQHYINSLNRLPEGLETKTFRSMAHNPTTLAKGVAPIAGSSIGQLCTSEVATKGIYTTKFADMLHTGA